MNNYAARVERRCNHQYVGMCKQKVVEGKNIMSFRFLLDDGIFEMTAQQIESAQDLSGDYKCGMSIRQFGTEKDEVENEWEEKIKAYQNIQDKHLELYVHLEEHVLKITVDTREDFTDFCQNN